MPLIADQQHIIYIESLTMLIFKNTFEFIPIKSEGSDSVINFF